MYERLHVTFLMDESDTIIAYEEQGKQKTASAVSSYQQGIDAFTSSLGRVQQIELLQGTLLPFQCMTSLNAALPVVDLHSTVLYCCNG